MSERENCPACRGWGYTGPEPTVVAKGHGKFAIRVSYCLSCAGTGWVTFAPVGEDRALAATDRGTEYLRDVRASDLGGEAPDREAGGRCLTSLSDSPPNPMPAVGDGETPTTEGGR